MDHEGHTVQWVTWEGGQYRLYCATCRRYTQYTTQSANSLQPQVFEQAMARPNGIAVDLQVQDVSHKRKTEFRHG